MEAAVPLDPQLRQVLDRIEELNLPSYREGTPEDARRMFRLRTVDLRPPEAVVPVGDVEDRTVGGAEGPLRARVYRPQGAELPLPTLAYFHGGGFVIGDLDTHDNTCRRLCRDLETVVVSVDYRLAPEAPFPAPVEDTVAAIRWIGKHIDEFGGDPDRLAVGGDSAGANLATVACQLIRDDGGQPSIAAQLLLYPPTDMRAGGQDRYRSRAEHSEGMLLTTDTMAWFEEQYLPDPAHRDDPRASPLLGNLEGLPPAVVITGEYDPLCSEGDRYAEALAEAGTTVVHRRFGGLLHGFFGLVDFSDACEEAARDTSEQFRRLL
jgi:acetyl esterase